MAEQVFSFIGLGVMGYPMAGHLRASGHRVRVYNRTQATAQRWQQQHGGEVATSVAQAAAGADVVFSCVGDDPDVREVLLGDSGALASMDEGALLIDHTTASAELAREIYPLAGERGVGFLDAPVSGGQAGAESGALTVMVGGNESDFRRAEPILETYAKQVQYIGTAGSGQLAKMVNQICIAGLVQGLAEAIHFAESAGLDIERVFGAISQGAAQSWQMDNRWETMRAGEFEHGFAVEWMRKDLRIAFAEAERCGADLPVTQQVDLFYAGVEAMGGKRWDTSSLIARLGKRRNT